MTEFNLLEGSLYVGDSADNDERMSGDTDDLYSHAVFQSDTLNITFYASIGGYFPVGDIHIQTVDGSDVYYPHQNETTVELHIGDLDDGLKKLYDSVSIQYSTVNGNLYICSQNEITAYGGTYLVCDSELYKIPASLLYHPDGQSIHDEFLDIEPVEEPVLVQNVDSEYSKPVSYDRLAELVENVEPNGALKLREPDNILDTALDGL